MTTSNFQKLVKSIVVLMLPVPIIACASTTTLQPADVEKLLLASGFTKAVADTPEKLDQLKKLPQRKLAPHEDGAKVFYIYADVENCRCAYAGDQKAYEKYKQLAERKQLSEEDRQYVERNRQRRTDSDDWDFNQAW
jgi:hypothetical protein